MYLNDPFGLHTEHMNTWQMMIRAIVVFFTALALIRIAGIRALGKQSAFDQLAILIIGSILGRAVIAGTNFFGALTAVVLIVAIHRLLAWLTFRSKAMGKIFKGEPLLLIYHGRKQEDNMAKAHITDEDLEEALRDSLNSDRTSHIHNAYLERSGRITFIKRPEEEKSQIASKS